MPGDADDKDVCDLREASIAGRLVANDRSAHGASSRSCPQRPSLCDRVVVWRLCERGLSRYLSVNLHGARVK